MGFSAAAESPPEAQDIQAEQGQKAEWLAPIPLEPANKRISKNQTSRRASQKGCLPMSLDDYLALVEWTGRAHRKDKVGRIPDECQPLFKRLQCDGETWMDWAKNFRQRFRNEVGRPSSRQAFKADRTARRQITI